MKLTSLDLSSTIKPIKLFLLSFSLLFISACEQKTEQSPAAVELTPISYNNWTKKLQDYRPDIVVVDMWAMWCTSCIKRFPKMVELNEKYANQGVKFVSLNLDDYQNTGAVESADVFLKEMNARFDNFHINENLIDTFEKLKLKGIPAVAIYDGAGKERYRLTGDNPNKQFTDADIEAAIEALLKEKDVSNR